jgi:hypothetical protein
MQAYEYRVVPAPVRGEKARGVKTTADRYALALANLMNALGREGWEYLRADSLPCEERAGLTGTRTTFQHMLVFRRPLTAAEAAPPQAEPAPRPLVALEPPAPATAPALGPATAPEPSGAPALGPAEALARTLRPKPDLAAE